MASLLTLATVSACLVSVRRGGGGGRGDLDCPHLILCGANKRGEVTVKQTGVWNLFLHCV